MPQISPYFTNDPQIIPLTKTYQHCSYKIVVEQTRLMQEEGSGKHSIISSGYFLLAVKGPKITLLASIYLCF